MRDFVFGLLGGTAFLIFGMSMLGDGLRRSAGSRMKRILASLTGDTYRAIAVSAGLTALMQSSSATSVLTVGFVNAGLMTLFQAVGVIYGANIGTTITAQLVAFKITDYALLFVALGFVIRLMGKNERLTNMGSALMGFGLMFVGIRTLNSGMLFVEQHALFRHALLNLSHMPVMAVLIGVTTTMLVQASAAIVAIAMVLAGAGLMDLTGAICIMLGTNIGTSITAQIASIGTNANARRVAWAHTCFNVIGVMITIMILPVFVRLASASSSDLQRQIANSHSMFNIANTLVFLPFTHHFVRLLERLVKAKPAERTATHLDERLQRTPAAALNACRRELSDTKMLLLEMTDLAFRLVSSYDSRLASKFDDDENLLNEYQKNITRYLMGMTRYRLSQSESRQSSDLLQATNAIERAGDHLEEIARLALRKNEEGVSFSDYALEELADLRKLCERLFESLPAIIDGGAATLSRDINDLLYTAEALRQNHVARLREGTCTVDAGVIFLDIINHAESIADLLSDVAAVLTPWKAS